MDIGEIGLKFEGQLCLVSGKHTITINDKNLKIVGAYLPSKLYSELNLGLKVELNLKDSNLKQYFITINKNLADFNISFRVEDNIFVFIPNFKCREDIEILLEYIKVIYTKYIDDELSVSPDLKIYYKNYYNKIFNMSLNHFQIEEPNIIKNDEKNIKHNIPNDSEISIMVKSVTNINKALYDATIWQSFITEADKKLEITFPEMKKIIINRIIKKHNIKI